MLLDQIKVRNFRGFQDVCVNNLSRFTLVAGRNDSGKTSLLEAVFMLSGMMIMDISARINSLRSVPVVIEEDLYSMFYAQEIDREISISGSFGRGLVRSLTLKSFTPKTMQYNPSVDNSGVPRKESLRASFRQKFSISEYGERKKSGELVFLSDSNGVLREFSRTTEVNDWRCLFLPAKSYFNGIDNLKSVILANKDHYILQILQKVDPAIRRLVLVGEKIFVDTGLSHLLPIQMLGDGLVKIINACAAVLICKGGGLVCLDEIDNGLHFSAMKDFWFGLTQFARDNDVQIIATTHDYDFLMSVSKETDKNIQSEFSYIKLVRRVRDGVESVFAYPYDFAQYSSAVESGTEIR